MNSVLLERLLNKLVFIDLRFICMHTFDLNLEEISKIEGKASLVVKVKDDKIEYLQFRITEYKRFYTQAIRGKDITAIPQLACRICGTCSNAHLLCAIKAIENALGINPSSQTMVLRKLLNFGLIIRDHALHLYVFALPDILKVDNILSLDENDPVQHQILDDLFLVKAAGNLLGKTIGGRSVHAPYPTIGGFTKIPQQQDLSFIINKLQEARQAVIRLINIFLNCEYYQKIQTEYHALIDSNLSFLEGTMESNEELIVTEGEFRSYLDHVIIPYSQASGYKFMGRLYMVGALSRINLARENLHPQTIKDAEKALDNFPSDNLYHNNLAQCIEILHAIDSSIEILKNLKLQIEELPSINKHESSGLALIEAPRGTLIYKINIDSMGIVKNGEIIVPTGQNQILIEKTIYDFMQNNLDKDKDFLTQEIEKIVRAFDPCMSCASHFLKVKWL